MKIRRIALEEFRRFRQPVVIDALDDGINLFVGPNEAGKSTVAEALRSAFLERFKTSSVTDLAPWSLPQARPSVSVDFELGGHAYQLNKQFLVRARCELLIDGGAQRLEGEQAEDELARLLGFEFAGRGQRRAARAGRPRAVLSARRLDAAVGRADHHRWRPPV
jgi:DNA repair exonuclease SbcCD ATPase subunit